MNELFSFFAISKKNTALITNTINNIIENINGNIKFTERE